MFSKNSAFLKLTLRTPPHRRKSDGHRAVHAVYAVPPQLFPTDNKRLNESFARLYWVIRSLQFRLFFQNEAELTKCKRKERGKNGKNTQISKPMRAGGHSNRSIALCLEGIAYLICAFH
uniref:Uncharacterized protein n=1 Tax=Globodera rostochiensis TaxID=31243 RepID=A0A914HE46_GLORO